MKSTQRRITNTFTSTTTPNVVEPDPEPIELFTDTTYSNTQTKRPIVEPLQQTTVVQNVGKSKRQKLNQVEPTYEKTQKKFFEIFTKTLPKELTEELENNNGKPHKSKSFTADVVFRHVLSYVLNYYKNPQSKVNKDFFKHLRWNQLLPDSLAAPKLSSNNLNNLQAATGRVENTSSSTTGMPTLIQAGQEDTQPSTSSKTKQNSTRNELIYIQQRCSRKGSV